MLEPLDRYRRDSTLFQFTTKRLRDFIDPAHLLIQIDEQVDFAKLVEPLEGNYSIDNGRPAIHPEVMVRAMLISALYNITSFRRLCLAISENIAFRWFCFLTIDDEVFDHSTITYFIERIGREGFQSLFTSFNQELLRLGLLSPKMYADSTLVRANVSSCSLSRSEMTVEEFQEKAVEENGLFVIKEVKRDEDGSVQEETKYYQDAKGRVPLSTVDLDARWRTHCHSEPTKLCYLESAIADENGFIVARSATRSSEAEWKVIPKLLGELPIAPETVTADSSYSAGELRKYLRDQNITAYIPLSHIQKRGLVSRQDFEYHEEYLICPEGKKLKRGRFYPQESTFKYGASQKDCRACRRKESCLWQGENRHRIRVSMYYPEIQRAIELNETQTYTEEIRKRKTIIEGVFACQDRLGWSRCKLRGLWKVDCEGFLAALAHTVLKLIRKLKARLGIPVCYGRQQMKMEGVPTY
jgi:transposase